MFQKVEYNGASRVLKKGVLNLFLSISMAYIVISCRKVAEKLKWAQDPGLRMNKVCAKWS